MGSSKNVPEDAFALRWGIIGTGKIAEKFAQDLVTDPSHRGVSDVMHILAGAGSSSSESKAQQFLTKVDVLETCDTFGNYEELVQSPRIDVVYIATPHSHHFPNALLALRSGKHVLCEKPLTVNSEQARKLVTVATQNNLFLMEGMWTRFQPIGDEIRRLMEGSEVGTVTRVFADNSLGMDSLKEFPSGDRMISKVLAGGALLDCESSTLDPDPVSLTDSVGPYSIQWVLAALSKEKRRPSEVLSVISKCHETEVDESTSILMKFQVVEDGSKSEVLGFASTSLRAADDYDGQTPGQGFGNTGTQVHEFANCIPEGVYGLAYEADEVARCIRDGKSESERMPWEETLTIMEIMDTVRRNNDLEFPADIESTEYRQASAGNMM